MSLATLETLLSGIPPQGNCPHRSCQPPILEGTPKDQLKNSLRSGRPIRIQDQTQTYTSEGEWKSRYVIQVTRLQSRRKWQSRHSGSTRTTLHPSRNNILHWRTPTARWSDTSMGWYTWSQERKQRMVEREVQSGDRRQQGEMQDHPSLSWSTHIWPPPWDKSNKRAGIKILLVASAQSECPRLCQRNKINTHPKKAPLVLITLHHKTLLFQTIAMDFIVKLPKTEGFNLILTITDHNCTKMLIAIPCRETINAKGVVELFLRQIFPRFELPSKIISNWDPQFISKFMKELCQLLGMTQNISTAYHPWMDGQSEWSNQWLEQYLCFWVDNQQTNWHHYLL